MKHFLLITVLNGTPPVHSSRWETVATRHLSQYIAIRLFSDERPIRFFLFEEDHLSPGEYSILLVMRSPSNDNACTINRVVTITQVGSKYQLFTGLLKEYHIQEDWIVEFCHIRPNN